MSGIETSGSRIQPDAERLGASSGRAARDPWLGRRVGRVRLRKRIGTGPRGGVYLATHVDGLGAEPLVVRLLGSGGDRRRLLRRFAPLRARLAQLDHPDIVRFIDVGATRSGQLYWVTAHVEGSRIDAYCDTQGTSLEARRRLVLRVCEAVAYAHAHAVVHGALGAETIRVDTSGRPQVFDFGLETLLECERRQSRDTRVAAPAIPHEDDETAESREEAPLQVSDDVRALGDLLESLCRSADAPGMQGLDVRRSTRLPVTRAGPQPPCASVAELIASVREQVDAGRRADSRQGHVVPAVRASRRGSSRRVRTVVAALATIAVLGSVLVLARLPRPARRATQAASDAQAYARHIQAAETALLGGRVAAASRQLEAADTASRGWEWRHLWARLDHSLMSVDAHSAPITAVAFGAADRLVATSAADRSIRVWDVASGELVGSLGPVPTTPRTLAMHAQLDWIAVGCDSGLVLVFDRNNEVRGRFEESEGRERALRSVVMVAGGAGRRASLEGGDVAASSRPSFPTVHFDPAGSRLAVGFSGGDVVLWDVPNLRRLTRWRLRLSAGTTALAFAPDGKRLAMGSGTVGTPIRVWDLESLERAQEFDAEGAGQTLLAFGKDGETLSWVAADGQIRMRVARQPPGVTRFASQGAAVRPLVFDPAGRILYGTVAADSGKGLVAVDATTGQIHARFLGHTAPIRVAAVSVDGTSIATADDTGMLKLWDARTQDVRCFVVPSGGEADTDVSASADGSWIMATTAEPTGAVGIWNVPRDTFEVVGIGGDQSSCVDVGRDARIAVVGHVGGEVSVIDFGSGVVRWRQHEHTGRVGAVDVAPSGRTFVTGGDDALVLVWDVASRTVTQRLRGHVGAVRDVEYAPDGASIVSCGQDGTLRFWDAQSGRLQRVLREPGTAVQGIAWAPDGQHLASVASDGALRLWDIGRDAPQATLLFRGDALFAVGFTPDGARVAAAGLQGRIHVLETRTWHEVAQLHGHTGPIIALEFSGDGGSMLTSSRDGTIRFWDTGRGVAGLEPASPWVPKPTVDTRHDS